MINLNDTGVKDVSAGTYAFCALRPNGELLCARVAWNGYEYVAAENPQVLPVKYIDGAVTFFV